MHRVKLTLKQIVLKIWPAISVLDNEKELNGKDGSLKYRVGRNARKLEPAVEAYHKAISALADAHGGKMEGGGRRIPVANQDAFNRAADDLLNSDTEAEEFEFRDLPCKDIEKFLTPKQLLDLDGVMTEVPEDATP